MRIRAYAKINLSLDILGVMDNGYHELDSLFQSISVYDTIDIADSMADGIHLACLPAPDGENIVMKAAQLFFREAGIHPAVDISIRKFVPFQAGLAGGSTDAAAVLRGLDIYYGTNMDDATLGRLALQLGADVPFFLKGGTCRATGVGERLRYIKLPHRLHYVLLKPFTGMNTQRIYGMYDAQPNVPRPDTGRALAALMRDDLKAFAAASGNVLEPAAKQVCGEIETYEQMLHHSGALYVAMSGSGSTVFGLYESEHKARTAAASLKPKTHFCTYAYSIESPIEIISHETERVMA